MFKRTFSYQFIIDDNEVVKPPETSHPDRWVRIWHHLRGKCYSELRLAHQCSTWVHIINVVLVYLVFGRNDIAFLTALLFGFNPVNNMASIWLSGRPYSLATGIILVGLLFYPIMPVVYGFAALLSPSAIFFPLIYCFKQPYLYILALPLIGYFFTKKFRGVIKTRTSGSTDEMTAIKPKKIIILIKTLGYYFRYCIFPIHIGMCHSYLHTFGLSDSETKRWYTLDKYFGLGLLVLAGAVYAFLHRGNPVAQGYLWFVLLTIPFCNFIMVNHPITERYMYLPLIGLMYALANIISHTPLAYVVLTAYILRLYYFMPAYKDMTTYWESNVKEFPDVAMGYNQYGLALVQSGKTGAAIDTWLEGVKLRPNDFRINYNIANVMLAIGQLDESLKYAEIAEKNLDQKQNSDFWIGEITKIRAEVEKRKTPEVK